MKTYLVDYWHNGAMWSIDIPAESWGDAEERLRQIQRRGKVTGELQAVIPVKTGGILDRLLSWLTGGSA